jgi:hypothetical protein
MALIKEDIGKIYKTVKELEMYYLENSSWFIMPINQNLTFIGFDDRFGDYYQFLYNGKMIVTYYPQLVVKIEKHIKKL